MNLLNIVSFHLSVKRESPKKKKTLYWLINLLGNGTRQE